MSAKRGKQLLSKYINGTAGKSERELVDYWYAKRMFKNMQEAQPEDYTRIKEEIWMKLDSQIPDAGKKVVKLWPRLAIAAAVAIVIIGVGFYASTMLNSRGNDATGDLITNTITPGKNRATLTLSNGKTISLSDAKTGIVVGHDLRYSDNTAIISNADNRNIPSNAGEKSVEMTLSTPRGGTYHITLSDGTKVWLNAASSLTYTMALNERGERRVKLEGEGYFEVAKDKKHPFIVTSNTQEVKVLGTHFNISSYADEPSVKTTLLEGSIDINGHILQPNQQAVNNGGKINILPADIESAMAWKNEEFIFNNEDLGSIMKKIARWYDVEVYYADQQMAKEKFWGTISRFGNIKDVLKMLEMTKQVQFKIEGRRIVVTK